MKKITLFITIAFLINSCQNNEPNSNENVGQILSGNNKGSTYSIGSICLLYTSDAADEL